MRLKHFRLRGFAQHDNVDLTFRQGEPNLIIGPNEAGKTHLMTALNGTIFGIESPEPYTPWHGDPVMSGLLTFSAGGDQVEIERRFLEQAVDVSVNGELIYSGRGLVRRNTQEDQRYQSLLHQWIGFAEHDVFLRTVFVGQDQIQDRGLGEFTAQIKRLITGTREASYETAILDLEEELDSLVMLPRKRVNRRREDLQEQLDDLNDRYRTAEEIQSQMVTIIEEERQLQAATEAARREHERYSTLVRSYEELQQATAKENQAQLVWKDLQEQIDRLKRARTSWQKQEAERNELRVAGNPDPDEIMQISRDIERLEPRIDYLRRTLKRNREVAEQLEFLNSELARFKIPGKVEVSEVLETARQHQQREQIVADTNRTLEELLRESPPRPRQPGALRHALFVTAGMIAFASVLLGFFLDDLFYFGLGIAALVLFAGLVADRGTQHHLEQNEEHAREIQRLRRELQESVDALKETQERRNRQLAASKVDTLHDLFYRAREYQATMDRLEALPEIEDVSEDELAESEIKLSASLARRDDLLRISGFSDLESLHRQAQKFREAQRILDQMEPVDDQQVDNLIDRLADAQRDVIIARYTRERLLRQFPELGEVSPATVSEYRQEIERAEQDVISGEKRLYQIQLDRQHLGRDAEDAGELRLRVVEVREQLQMVERSAAAHMLAIETLRSSVHAFQENALEPVGEQAGSYLMSITDGRYTSVELDRETMEPFVSANGQHGIGLELLSRGARDQLYLSIRAALIDALSGDRTLPMLLDDPCVNFDEPRLENAASLIAELAGVRQILLFTKDETWTRWYEPVLRLERS